MKAAGIYLVPTFGPAYDYLHKRLADVIATDGNPLDDMERARTGVRLVVQVGVVRRDEDRLVTENS